MNLYIADLWSPDLVPPDSCLPENQSHFEVFRQVAVSEHGTQGHEVFGFTVSSPSRPGLRDAEWFVTDTLCLNVFSWQEITQCLDSLLRQGAASNTWDEVIEGLRGYLKHADSP